MFPQDGLKFPLRAGFAQATFLTSGSSRIRPGGAHGGGPSTFGSAATTMTVEGDRIAMLFTRLNRLSTDGASGGRPLEGPAVSLPEPNPYLLSLGPVDVGPTSAAFSPDGRSLYMTGYVWGVGQTTTGRNHYHKCVQGVTRIGFEGKEEMKLFAGKLTPDGAGKGPGQFTDPVGVACDVQGRVYVADYMNDRLQVFSPEGGFLKAISCAKPVRVQIHPKSGEIYVFSWVLPTENFKRTLSANAKLVVPATLTRLRSFDDPRPVAQCPLPLGSKARPYDQRCPGQSFFGGLEYSVELDAWTDPPTLWVVSTPERLDIEGAGIRRYAVAEKEVVELSDSSADALKTLGNQIPAGQKGAGYPAIGQPGGAADVDGKGVFTPTPCYAWNNTYNGARLNMTLRRWPDPKQTERQAEIVKEGRDFFNEKPPEEYYKPYVYPHPLQAGKR
jgi:hypothetical protein